MSPPKPATNQISFNEKQGLLKLSVSAYPLGRLMQDIADETGIDLIIYDSSRSLEEEVTLHFDSLPLRQALERVLNGRSSYTIVSAVEDPQQTRVWILSKSDPRSVRTKKASKSQSAARSLTRQEAPGSPPSDQQLRALEEVEIEQFLKEIQQEAGLSAEPPKINEGSEDRQKSLRAE